MAIQFLNTVAVDTDVLYVDTANNRVGIGTSNPDRQLQLKSSLPAIRLEDSDVSGLYHEFFASTAGMFQFKADGGNVQANSGFLFQVDNSERMRIDSSGNVGIGLTNPSRKLAVSDSGVIADFLSSTTSSYIDIEGTSAQLRAGVFSGVVGFANGSGTTPHLVINSNGNVGIGTTNPAELLTVSASDDVSIRINSTKNGLWTAEQKLGALEFFGNDGSGEGAALKGYVNLLSKNTFGAAFDMTFGTTDGTNGISERMRIAYNGNVGIGTSTPQGSLSISNNGAEGIEFFPANASGLNTTQHYNRSGAAYAVNKVIASEHRFNIGTAEKVRINSSGQVGIGLTNPSANLHVYGNGQGAIIRSLQTIGLEVQGGGNSTDIAIFKNTSGTEKFSLNTSGQMFNLGMASSSSANASLMHNSSTGLIYRYTSSIRYKEDVKDLTNAVDKIMKLRPVEFKPKDSLKYTTGMIAEEVFEVMPEITFESEVEGFDTPQVDGISYEPLHAYYIKAIQELSSKIESLETRIQTLENN